MNEQPPHGASFSSPEEEVAYLRKRIAERERMLETASAEREPGQSERLAREELDTYKVASSGHAHQMNTAAVHDSVERVSSAENKIAEILEIAHTKGIRNALAVLDKLRDPHITDEVHRALIGHIRAGRTVAELKEGVPPWDVLHMTLFEVTLPSQEDEDARGRNLKELISSMEQFYAGMRSIGGKKNTSEHFTIEIAVSENSDDIIFYVAIPNTSVDLFEKQLFSLFPHALLREQKNDYNIFAEGGTALISTAKLDRHPIYPLRTYEEFDHDPLNVLLNTFSKIERDGSGASVQISIRPKKEQYHGSYRSVIKRVHDGMSVKKAIHMSTLGGEFLETMKDLFAEKKKDDSSEIAGASHGAGDEGEVEQFEHKLESPIMETNIRIAVSATSTERAEHMLSDIESSFNQFENTNGNGLSFSRLSGSAKQGALQAFSFREFDRKHALPLSTQELTTLVHFPLEGTDSSPQFKQSHAKAAAAPVDMPREGTLLGVNRYRGDEKKIYITPEDRLRHFYIIGQTGTGKTTLMKNMVLQDIEQGNGVCMIDPHGTDIADILAVIPEERKGDVIYFDPAHSEQVMGLNLLEYDAAHPEQKTFVVNELFSIFQKLYGAVPESMGPMFEQYFRNATLLVLEDPESGSTLLDVSRVMADPEFRRAKLEKATNPVVIQFWTNIATQAGGEAALENIVPYITSKFDVFTANDFMRPIIGQQHSAFNFRRIMDERKILLVNLSKGRLGEINANLIGMIIVGKILMAALSRVDASGGDYAPFYLHMDEFQNITSDSVAAILSEARKYRLGLTIAHQYIDQIEEGIRDAVFGNVGSLVAFRVGSDDAEFLERQFTPTFQAADLINVENRHAFVRMLSDGTPTRPFSLETMPPRSGTPEQVHELIERSYEQYGEYRTKVEMEIAHRY